MFRWLMNGKVISQLEMFTHHQDANFQSAQRNPQILQNKWQIITFQQYSRQLQVTHKRTKSPSHWMWESKEMFLILKVKKQLKRLPTCVEASNETFLSHLKGDHSYPSYSFQYIPPSTFPPLPSRWRESTCRLGYYCDVNCTNVNWNDCWIVKNDGKKNKVHMANIGRKNTVEMTCFQIDSEGACSVSRLPFP